MLMVVSWNFEPGRSSLVSLLCKNLKICILYAVILFCTWPQAATGTFHCPKSTVTDVLSVTAHVDFCTLVTGMVEMGLKWWVHINRKMHKKRC
jgi:hypothetical protein